MHVVFVYQSENGFYSVEAVLQNGRILVREVLLAGVVEFHAITFSVEQANRKGAIFLLVDPLLDPQQWLSFIEEFMNITAVME